ncbi:MAG: ATP-binding cassette domain-containing protein [Ignisphaera sp.]
MGSILEVDDLFVWFGEKEILKGVSLSVGEGDVACVFGSTGSGKTTLLKVVTGVLQELYKGFRVEGDIKVCGLGPLEALRRGLVAYVPQDVYSFFIASTPREELAILGIGKCNCNFDLDRDISKLSDGQLYRFLLYSALASGAKLIAIDEPSSHIDWWSIEEVFEYVKGFAKRSGVAIIVVDHRVDLVKRYCNIFIEIGKNPFECSETPSLRGIDVSKTVISAENIHVVLNGEHILKGANISLGLGEAVAIVGRNGSGKTTLLNTLAGIIKPSSGKVTVYRGKKIFVVPQNPVYWFPSDTVEGVVRLFANRHRFRDCVEDVLEMFGLGNEMHKNVYSLSVGKARLLSLALAYISKADVIIVDEPTLGLDCMARESMLETFNHLIEDGKAILVATHDLDFAMKFPRVYMIDGGVVKQLNGNSN